MSFNLTELLNDIDVKYKKSKQIYKNSPCIRYALAECFFDSSHTNNDACFFQYESGAIAYKCQHNSCKDKTWQDVRTLLDFKYNVDLGQYWSKNGKKETQALPLQFTTFYEICKKPVERKSIITGFIDEGDQTIISGNGGVGKSMLAFNLAYELAVFDSSSVTGDEFFMDNAMFGKFPIPKRRSSLFVQSENNHNQVNIRMNKMAGNSPENREALKGIHSPLINDDVLTTGKTFQDTDFQQWNIDLINRIEDQYGVKIDLLFIDPLISFISRDENDAASMRKDLDGITKVAHAAKVTPIIIHHNKKDGSGYRGSSAISDSARNLISLKPEWISEQRIVEQCGDEIKTRDAKIKCIKVEHVKCNNFEMFDPFIIRPMPNNRFKLVESALSPEVVEQCNLICQALRDMGGRADSQKELAKAYGELSDGSPTTCKRYIKIAVDEGFILREPVKDEGYARYAYFIKE